MSRGANGAAVLQMMQKTAEWDFLGYEFLVRSKADANSICPESLRTRTAIDTLLKIERQLVKCALRMKPVQIHKVFVIVFEMFGTINFGTICCNAYSNPQASRGHGVAHRNLAEITTVATAINFSTFLRWRSTCRRGVAER